jgi:Ni/Fe-hydrogenase subunit HybB-like protein
MAPSKLHPLWYTPFIPVYFFTSAVVAGLSMVVVECSLSHRIFREQLKDHHVDTDPLVLGLGKAAAIMLFAYFFLKLQSVAEGDHWDLLVTGWGALWLVEVVGLVLIPSIILAVGVRHRHTRAVRWGAGLAVLGVVMNRLDISLVAMNWNLPNHYVPSWMEVVTSITLVMLGLICFRWIVNRMPVLREDPAFPTEH